MAAGLMDSSKAQMAHKKYTFVVEHLDPELGSWSKLEYQTIDSETLNAGCNFLLSSVPSELLSSEKLKEVVTSARSDPVEEYFADRIERICLLDPSAKDELCPEDGDTFDVFLFGGILGDDPPRDRTSELRKRGFKGRRLGPVQMTTDTAVRVTRMVILEKKRLNELPYIDFPELHFSKHESTQMPFRYIKRQDGTPVMPKGMLALIRMDADKAFDF